VPALEIHLDRLRANARAVVELCSRRGISVCGVAKATMGSPLVARAMLEGGVSSIGESRIDNIIRLRRNGITAPILMLRIPSPSEAADVVAWADGSLNSEAPALDALSRAAVAAGKVHEVILMVELGDRREGAPPETIPALSARTVELAGLRLAGIGVNFMCVSGVLPSREKLEQLGGLAQSVERQCGVRLRYVSGGNSSSLPLLEGGIDARINHLRVGASILLGENPWTGGRFDNLKRDAFLLEGELVELKTKPSRPEGEVGRDAFGDAPDVKDRGERLRGIVNLGRLDINPRGLRPHRRSITTVAASSDHLIVDLTRAPAHRVGDSIDFELDYASLVQVMLSPYVRKHVVGTGPGHSERQVVLLSEAAIAASPQAREFVDELKILGLSLQTLKTTNPAIAAGKAAMALRKRRVPIILGSERHSLTPLLQAMRRQVEPLGLLWMDSRPALDPDGINVLGEALTGSPELGPLIASGCALVGLREASRAEARFIREHEVLALTMEDVDLFDVREVMRRALAQVTSLGRGFALCLNGSVINDISDPTDAGLSYRECSFAMELVAATRELRAIALTGLSLSTEPPQQIKTKFGYLLSAFGKRILGI
jgi:predicted amino acid racemase/arginase family enzyme